MAAVPPLRDDVTTDADGAAPAGAIRRADVWIGPERSPLVEDAVALGGGRQVPSDDANVIVWCSSDHDLSEAPAVLHDGVEWVQLDSAGVDHWIEAGLLDDQRRWTSARGVYGRAVAEHVMALLLAACRRLADAARARRWTPHDGELLAGKAIGILGAGGIGVEVIARIAPFGSRTIALTDDGEDVSGADVSLGPDDVDHLMRESDHVVVALPLTPSTRGLIGTSQLELLGPKGWLVNVGRGAVVQTDALVAALRAGRLGGACLDVTDPEPLPESHPLWALPNVLITSHSANTASMALEAYAGLVAANLVRFRAGEPLTGVVEVQRGY